MGSIENDTLWAVPSMVFPLPPLLVLSMPREDAVRAYSTWQQSQVSTTEQKEHYNTLQELTLAHCYDLDMLAANQEQIYQFYIRHGIPAGVAWRYVCDIKSFLAQREMR
jgi:hypothetical protein